MNSIEWHLAYDAFCKWALIARQHGFYRLQIDEQERALLAMSPYPKESEKHESN